MQQLSDQEVVRRESLQKIIDLGINPFPAEKFDINYKSTSFSTKEYHEKMYKEIEKLKHVGPAKAKAIVEKIFENKFRIGQLLEDADFCKSNGITEQVEFDKGVEHAPCTFEEYAKEVRETALGDFGFDKFGYIHIAGRFMGQRGPFAKLQDSHGTIQLYLNKKVAEVEGLDKDGVGKLIKQLHIGDFIGIKGKLFSTGVGEVSIKVFQLTFLSKSLRSLPVVKVDAEGKVHDAFTDPELRYRQRYVDLVVNPKVKEIFLKRSKVITSMRNYFVENDWIEVETPVLQPIHGGAAARPFTTHHNTLDMPLYLRIANELYLKRLIVGGFEGVFEFGKMFRNEGMDRTHNPEFTSMEIYVAYKDYNWMMEMVEICLARVAKEVTGDFVVENGDAKINFEGPYKRWTMFESIEHFTGIDISKMDEEALRATCKKLQIGVDKTMGKGKLIDEIFGEKVEANLIQPTYITDYPIEMTPLAKKHRSVDGLVERFELFVQGKEIANAYSELNDPIDQKQRLIDQLELANRGDDEAMVMDEDFVRALEYGMPPTSGLGIGIDRLTMLLTNQSSIQEVLFFPQMKAETKE